ncbi:MAG: phosphatidylserine decarboxylase family protein [Desulfomonile sp.]|jgi:phosphatidylserine decarboxylase
MISKTGHYEPIAREGFVFIIPPLLISIAAWWLHYPWTSLFFIGLAVAVALFFRNPERLPPDEDNIVLCPADGTVVELVENVGSETSPEHSLKRISIFMSVFNTHVNRCPVSGTVTKIAYSRGKFLDARKPSASVINEHNTVVIDGDHGRLEVVQIAGMIARRIACWVREGDEVRRGDRFGLIRFGSRLDVYMPKSFTFSVKVGAKVRAGTTIIAEYKDAQ